MSEFFVRRPIVAIVIAILMMLIGGVCILALPVAQYPQIAPPEIQVHTHYTGADALTIEQSVATPIEQQMSGVDNMNYMYSINANNGDMRMFVNFDIETDPNIDQVLTQLRVGAGPIAIAGGREQLRRDRPKIDNGAADAGRALFAQRNLRRNVSRQLRIHQSWSIRSRAFPAFRNVQIFGAGQYAMRLWVKPDQLAKLGITVPDIITAVQRQNTCESCWPDRGRADSLRAEVYLHRARTGPAANAGGIRRTSWCVRIPMARSCG